MIMVNIGCGSTYHLEWINLDIASNSPHVISYDIRKGLPFEDNSCDVVYSSHLLEHLKQCEAHDLVAEVYRVLRPGGIFRIVVPDLEQIARQYLLSLEHVREQRNEVTEANYDWMMLELYDQTVRTSSGGHMLKYLKRDRIVNKSFVIDRIGQQANDYFENRESSLSLEEALHRLKERIQQKKVCVFGSGQLGAKVVQLLQDEGFQVHSIIDNDKSKWGQKLLEIPITSPDQIPSGSYVVVASSWWREISTQLVEMGLEKEHDFYCMKSTMFQKTTEISDAAVERERKIQEVCKFINELLGEEMVQIFREAVFRSEGEIHQWMYDSFSLGRLLEKHAFKSIKKCSADESLIPNFQKYQLDMVGGQIRKPDSLYMEGIK